MKKRSNGAMNLVITKVLKFKKKTNKYRVRDREKPLWGMLVKKCI